MLHGRATLFLDAREAGGLGWNDARGPIKGQHSYVINETMISPGQENNAYHSPFPPPPHQMISSMRETEK
jgi:hypothetical protein